MTDRLLALTLGFLLAFSSGCGPSIANVQGKVSADGKEATSGGIALSPLGSDGKPIRGTPGMADIRTDGTFSMDVELASAGTNRFVVRFSPPSLDTKKAHLGGVVPYAGYVPKDAEVELKPGPNTVAIEIVPGKKPGSK
jgi:hypothetical protein